jgi:arginase
VPGIASSPRAGIGLLGVPTNSAGTTDGVALAPAALRGAGLVAALERSSASSVVDYGDVALPAPSPVRDPKTRVIDPEGVKAMVAEVRDGVAAIVADERFPLVVGGDCPILLGCLWSIGEGDERGLLFVDGHEDAYAPERSTTGEGADMELGFALGTVDTSWWRDLPSPLVALERTWLLGPRDRSTIEAYGTTPLGDRVPVHDAATVATDPGGITAAAVGSLSSSRWWLHVDLDVLSTEALPAIDYPQEGGLSWDELEIVTTTASAAGPVGWDVTIYNPDLDPTGIHADRIVAFLGAAAGALPSRGR